MKAIRILYAVFLCLTASLPFYSQAQTYNLTTNTSASSAGFTSCTGCIFNLSPGVTFTIDKNGASCSSCTFTGGTIIITQPINFYTAVTFSGTTLVDNVALTFQNPTFTSDSVAINAATTFQSSGNFTGDRMSFNAAITCQACTFSNDSIHMTNQALNLQSSTATFTNTNFTLSGTSSITSTAGITLNNSTFSYNNTASFINNGGTFTSNGSTQYLNGNSSFRSTSGVILKNNSEILVGDGTLASTAYMLINSGTALNLYDNSLIKVSNGNNSYQNNTAYKYTNASSVTTSYPTSTNTISCGGSNPHACTTNYVYGCATLNNGGALACTILAIAGIDLSAMVTGSEAVTLSWTDANNTNEDHFQVQRSAGSQDWTTIGTLTANGYTTGDYQFQDPAPAAGTNTYRIQVIDKEGHASYSTISTVTVDHLHQSIHVYPNPVTSHTFFVRTASTSPVMVNLFTLSGQLLSRTSLEGQTQYTLKLPASLTPGNYMVVQVIGTESTQAFNLLIK